MIVRIRVSVDADFDDGTSEKARRGVELSLAQFREGLEAVIASKLTSEFPKARVEFPEDEEGWR